MKALFTYGAEVPLGRVISEHRRWLWPVGIVLLVNVAVLLGIVLPLRQSVANGAARAEASAQSLRDATADVKNAEATRDGQARASTDLDKFYADILPANMTAARRITHIKLAQLARTRGVDFQGNATSKDAPPDSSLERMKVSYALSGDWDDIRQFLYEIETGPDFVVIDNVQLSEGKQDTSLSLTLDLSTYYRIVDGR